MAGYARYLAFAAALIGLCLLVAPASAMAQQGRAMHIELSENRVDITTGFNGARIILFGITSEPGPDIAVTLRGPERTVVMRRKEKILGAWINRRSVEFRRVPGYYDYAATYDAVELGAMPELASSLQLGVDALDFYAEETGQGADYAEHFRDALIRGQQAKGLYPIRAGSVTFVTPRFFKVAFDLPPGVPTGIYNVEAALIENGEVFARENKSLQVGQVGFSANVYLFATRHAFFYGVFAVIIALASGWAAFMFLRRE
ncbi:MAG: TIGR02186 family protein [Micavibrio sp.]